jgi:hypothetical protein
MGTRRAIVQIDEQVLQALLEMPQGLRVLGVQGNWRNVGIDVMIEGPELEEVSHNTEPPILRGAWEFDEKTRKLRWVPPPLP